MIRHVARLGAASLLVVGSMLLPFLPGRYDGLAVTLSWMAQLLGIAGLILIPLGAIWLALEVRSGTKDDGTASARWQTGVAVASITASTAAAALLSLYAATTAGLSLGVGFIGLWAYAAARLFAGVRSAPRASVRRFNAMPLYLVVLPSVAAIGRMTLVGPAAELSRNRAIESSTELINDIERLPRQPRLLSALSAFGLGGLRPRDNGRGAVSLRAQRRSIQPVFRAFFDASRHERICHVQPA